MGGWYIERIDMSNELIVFTHNDLDALGCMLNIEFKWPNINKKYFHTNYANINEIVDDILQHKEQNGNTHIIIPDVAFSDKRDALKKLYDAFDHITHIDHHMYPEGFWDEFPKMKVVYDKSKCATLLCNEYLGNKGMNSNLDKLTFLIDVYDIWQDKSEFFDISQDLNEYFWANGTVNLLDKIVENEYKLPKDFMQSVESIRAQYNACIEGFEQRKLIHRADEITVAFVDEWFNQILVREMRKGQNFVIGVNSYGIVKVRINQDCPYTEDQLNGIRFDLTGNTNYGHLHAFTYKVANNSFDNLMDEIKKVTSVISSNCA